MRPGWWRSALLAVLAGLGCPPASAQPAAPNAAAQAAPAERTPVDLELVLAVDVSRSMDPDEQALLLWRTFDRVWHSGDSIEVPRVGRVQIRDGKIVEIED